MLRRTTLLLAALVLVGAPLAPSADAQILRRLKEAAEDQLEQELEELIRNGVRCVFDDLECIRSAEESGQDVVLTDDQGQILTDDEGRPVTDPSEVDVAPTRPGEGAWANYDFVPGERVLFYEDYRNDRVGDFPRRLELVRGNWEVVEWEGRRLLHPSSRHATVEIPLPEVLPERFTVELEAHFSHGNQTVDIYPSEITPTRGYTEGNYFRLHLGHAGVQHDRDGVEATASAPALEEGVTPVRIMVDGSYAKMYVNERRVANVPNVELARTDVVSIKVHYPYPAYLGSIRIAAGGRDLYDALESEGRVATRGILFGSGSNRIRPESTPTLEEIARMLVEHPDLRISIEGHTDSDGDEAFNQELSERRAAAVKRHLVEAHGIDAGRLETAGFGESRPAASNETPEGKEQNRRVELVRIG